MTDFKLRTKGVWIFDPEGMRLERISTEKGNDPFFLLALCTLPFALRA
jgi:hypothetical protein